MRRICLAAAGARTRPRRRRFEYLFLNLVSTRGLGRSLSPDMLYELDAVILQDALRAADRVALAVKQMADAAQEVDIVRPVIAPAAAALHRLDLLKARFPETQHVLRQVEVVFDFADRPERFGRLFHHRLPFYETTRFVAIGLALPAEQLGPPIMAPVGRHHWRGR